MAKRKSREAADETPAAPATDLVEFPPPESHPEIPVAEHAGEPPEHGDAHEGPAADQPEPEPKKWANPDPHGRHGIDLGDKRRIRFARSNKWQQSMIFITAPDGVDPRPSKDDTAFLKEHGFRWRGDEQAWTRQLLSPDDKAEIDAIKAEHGDQEAAKERSKRRGNNDADAQGVFVQLANTIRSRSGLSAIDYTFTDQQHER